MQRSLAILPLAATLILSACRQTTASGAPQRHVIAFEHADARRAANVARAELGQPPMEGLVRIECDGVRNSWIVEASPADFTRLQAIARRLDQ